MSTQTVLASREDVERTVDHQRRRILADDLPPEDAGRMLAELDEMRRCLLTMVRPTPARAEAAA